MSLLKAAWRQLGTFSGFGREATSYLWPRWLVLRGVGLVYASIFFGILQEGNALVGPSGLSPIARTAALAEQIFPNVFERVLRVPSLFLISSDPLVIAALQWSGLAAAIALVLNLWPRSALFACWAIFLSFVATWEVFSATLNDRLMLETALLCIPFAPSGLRPGLGAASPPRPITVLMMRWLIIRIMLGAGLAKITTDPRWLDFTIMEQMYETSPARLFADNPFSDGPPSVVRMIVYRFTFTDRKTHRETGRYWNKEYIGDYAPPVAGAGLTGHSTPN